jgi:hypothetical protein
MEIKAELAAGRGGATKLASASSQPGTGAIDVGGAARARAASLDANLSLGARGSFEKALLPSRSSVNLEGGGGGGVHHATRTEAIKVRRCRTFIRAPDLVLSQV